MTSSPLLVILALDALVGCGERGDAPAAPPTAATADTATPSGTGLRAHSAERGHSAETGWTGATHSGHTATPPMVLPSCDIPWVLRAPYMPIRVSVDDVRSAWTQVGDPTEPMYGLPVEIVALRDGSRQLALGIQLKAAFFALPRTGEFALTDATSVAFWDWSNGWSEQWARGDWTGDPGEDLVVAQQSEDEDSVLSPPMGPGAAPVRTMASVRLDSRAIKSYPLYDSGDWNGDGREDLLVTWDFGDEILGTRYPPLPYPLGGAAVYTSPLPPRMDLLDADPPAAWYDAPALDSLPNGTPHSGLRSLLVPDIDGDGRDDVLVAGTFWSNLAERSPPDPIPWNMGGFALFSGGSAGLNTMGSERTLLAAVCRSDQSDLLEVPTLAREIGDVDGDGVGDLALLADHVDVPNGFTEVVFVVTRLPQLEGLHTYTEASGAVIVDVQSPGHEFMDAVSLGDLDGDGLGDFALSLFGDGVYVFLSPVTGFVDLQTAALKIVGNADSSASFGVELTFGEVDGDAWGDLVISDDRDRGCCGAVHVVSGQALRDALGL